jgi:hypothetical protein
MLRTVTNHLPELADHLQQANVGWGGSKLIYAPERRLASYQNRNHQVTTTDRIVPVNHDDLNELREALQDVARLTSHLCVATEQLRHDHRNALSLGSQPRSLQQSAATGGGQPTEICNRGRAPCGGCPATPMGVPDASPTVSGTAAGTHTYPFDCARPSVLIQYTDAAFCSEMLAAAGSGRERRRSLVEMLVVMANRTWQHPVSLKTAERPAVPPASRASAAAERHRQADQRRTSR